MIIENRTYKWIKIDKLLKYNLKEPINGTP